MGPRGRRSAIYLSHSDRYLSSSIGGHSRTTIVGHKYGGTMRFQSHPAQLHSEQEKTGGTKESQQDLEECNLLG